MARPPDLKYVSERKGDARARHACKRNSFLTICRCFVQRNIHTPSETLVGKSRKYRRWNARWEHDSRHTAHIAVGLVPSPQPSMSIQKGKLLLVLQTLHFSAYNGEKEPIARSATAEATAEARINKAWGKKKCRGRNSYGTQHCHAYSHSCSREPTSQEGREELQASCAAADSGVSACIAELTDSPAIF